MIYNATKSSEVEKGISTEEEGKSAKGQGTSNTDEDGNGDAVQPSPQGTSGQGTQEK